MALAFLMAAKCQTKKFLIGKLEPELSWLLLWRHRLQGDGHSRVNFYLRGRVAVLSGHGDGQTLGQVEHLLALFSLSNRYHFNTHCLLLKILRYRLRRRQCVAGHASPARHVRLDRLA